MEKIETNLKQILPQKNADVTKSQTSHVEIASHTDATVNWTALTDKLTIPNFINAGLTFGSAQTGAVIGSGLSTGIGFAIGGPAGAAIGYYIGNLTGFGTGAFFGHKLGNYTAKQFQTTANKNILENAATKITADTKKFSKTQKEHKK